jgi:DNA-binding YbaB/EbfC family protein
MQADVEKTQEELGAKEFESTAGGGAINVKVSGTKQVKQINISKDVVDPDDVEMLQDLIITCINDAFRKVDEAQASQMGKYNIPGLM